MFFFTVLFPDMGSNECANHVSVHWPDLNFPMWELCLVKIEMLLYLEKLGV